MNFLQRLFNREPKQPQDRGIYVEIGCGKCHETLRLRIDPQYDLNPSEEGGGYDWHKGLVCDKCFHKMQAFVQFDGKYQVRHETISGHGYLVPKQPLSA